jgi:hypothetical protein
MQIGRQVPVRIPRPRVGSILPALVFSGALSLAFVCGAKIVSNGSLRKVGFTATHLEPLHAVDALWFVLLTALFTAIVMQVPRLYLWLHREGLRSHVPADRRHALWMQLALTGGIALAWLPTLLTYSPGGVNVDALFSVNQALFAGSRLHWDNHHPVAYALFLRVWLAIGTAFHSVNLGVFIAAVVQYVIMAAVCAYCIVWLAKKGIPTVFLVLGTLFFALFPAFWLFAVGLSQDSLFAALVLLYSLHLIDVIESDGELLRTVRGGLTFAVLSLLVIFCRNNGVVLVVGAGIALICIYRLRIKPIYALLVGVLALTAIIQGPVYDAFKVNRPIIEALAIPLQQMAYVDVTGGRMGPADRTFLDHLLAADRWKLAYAPACVDPLKGDPAFSSAYLSSNKVQAAKTWLSLLAKNPASYVNAYALETFGYWKPVLGTWPAVGLEPIATNSLGIHQTDLIAVATGRSLTPFFDTLDSSALLHICLNVGVAVWLAFLSAAVLVSLGKPRYIAGLVPCYGSWLGFMLAAPIAFTYRYLLMFVICLPLLLLLPLIALRRTADVADPAGGPDADASAGEASAT